jgi:cation:H+ antiporter
MLILAILDAIYRPMPVLSKALQGNILSAGFGIFLLSTVAIGLVLGNRIFPLGWIGLYSPLIVLIYLFAMRLVYFYERRQVSVFIKEMAAKLKYEDISLKTAILKFSINAVFVIIAAVFLPKVGEGIAESTGLGQTFVGSIFIAIVTTIPEVVVSIAAVRIGAIDLAMGNLFGSNIFNIFILAIDDFFFIKGPILSLVNQNHIISTLFAIAMTSTAIIGLTYRAEKRTLFLALDSIVIMLLYIANLLSLYMLK